MVGIQEDSSLEVEGDAGEGIINAMYDGNLIENACDLEGIISAYSEYDDVGNLPGVSSIIEAPAMTNSEIKYKESGKQKFGAEISRIINGGTTAKCADGNFYILQSNGHKISKRRKFWVEKV